MFNGVLVRAFAQEAWLMKHSVATTPGLEWMLNIWKHPHAGGEGGGERKRERGTVITKTKWEPLQFSTDRASRPKAMLLLWNNLSDWHCPKGLDGHQNS